MPTLRRSGQSAAHLHAAHPEANREMNPAWVAFFAEALRLAELKRQRQEADGVRTAEGKRENQIDVKPAQIKGEK